MKIFTIPTKFLLPAILFSFTLLFNNCQNNKQQALGSEDEIIVIADSSEYLELEGNLQKVFGKVIYTPQPENLFRLRRGAVKALDTYKGLKNLLIIAPLNSGTYTSQYIKSILDSTVTHLVNIDSIYQINRHDLWAQDQFVMILTAPSLDRLNERLLEDQENLLYQFRKASNSRLEKSVYSEKFEQPIIEAQLLQEHGWTIYVQADYKLAKDAAEDNFVWIRRSPGTDMESWIFVHWIDNATPEWLHADSVSAIRNRLSQKFYRTMNDSSFVEIADDYQTNKEIDFKGRYALMTQGLWRMNDKSMGGPFINYIFYDEQTQRIYMVDGSIYAPKYYKKEIIQQIDVTLHSFLTEGEITPQRKAYLLDKLKKD
ncbi:MAG: DUF4837 family protein [Bacteroidetes bacterium]|nr:DUF4837 family protein [Bacteroidota bacterium]